MMAIIYFFSLNGLQNIRTRASEEKASMDYADLEEDTLYVW